MKPQKKSSASSEYANIAVRYKLPNQSNSQELTQIVSKRPAIELQKADDDTRFVVAVASFAELLKGGQYTGSLTWQDIQKLAESSQGKDEDGLRAEFLELLGIAQSLSSKQPSTD